MIPSCAIVILALEFEYLGAEGEMSDRWDSESADTDYATPRSVEIRLTVGTAVPAQTIHHTGIPACLP
jgi:hypothetical protein